MVKTMQEQNFPFAEIKVEENVYERIFDEDVDPEELKWHRDGEDRKVRALFETDWKIQLDNELPQSLKEEVFIPKGAYHRLIKGTGDLVVVVKKIL